jgi:hypothetical protein
MREFTYALLITMFDEVKTVVDTIRNSKKADACFIIQSGDISFDEVQAALNERPYREGSLYQLLPNLGDEYSRWELPAQALCRNYGSLFTMAAAVDVDYIVAVTGDTLLEDWSGIDAIVQKMIEHEAAIGCMRAIGQNFHSALLTEEDLESGKGGGRLQGMVCDFQPQLFVAESAFVRDLDAFCEIPVTNRWCSEQCLGDAFFAAVESMRDESGIDLEHRALNMQYLYAKTAYDFDKGVKWHVG